MPQEAPAASPEYYTCLISYNHKDEVIAKRLYNDLIRNGVKCWIYTRDVKIGNKIQHKIKEALDTYDKVLVIFSQHSTRSNWVADEVTATLKRETRENKEILFPISIDDAAEQAEFGWVSWIHRDRHIAEFINWRDSESYQAALQLFLTELQKPPLTEGPPNVRPSNTVDVIEEPLRPPPSFLKQRTKLPLIVSIVVILLFVGTGVLYITHPTIFPQRSSQTTASDWPYSSSSATVTDSLAQDHGNWITHIGDNICNYENGSYISSYQDQGNSMCDSNYSWRQVAFMIEYTQRSGTPPAGILMSIGLNSKTGECYLIYVGGNGTYILRYRPSITSPDKVLQEGQTATLHRSDKTNTMGVISYHNTLSLYVNNQFITSVTNAPSLSGLIALGASAVDNSLTTIAFNNMKIWALT